MNTQHPRSTQDQLSSQPTEVLIRFEKAGDTATGVFCGEPRGFPVHEEDGHRVPCTQAECPRCRAGTVPTFRVLFNFYTTSDGAMRVIEGDREWLEDINRLASKFGLDDMVYEIECRAVGEGAARRYLMLPEGQLVPEQQKALARKAPWDLVLLNEVGEEGLLSETSKPGQRRQDDALKADLKGSLRFVHHMAMQTRLLAIESRIKMTALLEELIASKSLDVTLFEERAKLVQSRHNKLFERQVSVKLSEAVDKYTLTDLPNIDCGDRIALCKGRCCQLSFPLSSQDLDERVVEWNYAFPYLIRKRPDSYCVHSCEETHHCLVYHNRPAICRSYSCRNDKRVWINFEKRIIAPNTLGGRQPDPENAESETAPGAETKPQTEAP